MRVMKYFGIETGSCLQGTIPLSVVSSLYTGLEKEIVDSVCPFVDKTSGLGEFLASGCLLVRIFAHRNNMAQEMLDDHFKFRPMSITELLERTVVRKDAG